MNTLTLYRERGSWMVRYGGPHAAEVRRLFGTDCLPSAYRDIASAQDVVQTLRATNPDVQIVVEG